MATTIEGVTVKIEADPDNELRRAIIVQVRSRKHPGLKASQSIDPGQAQNVQQLFRAVAAAAAVDAEYLGEHYGDTIDPSVCIQNALRALGEEARLVKSLSEGVPDKLKRLLNNQSQLSSMDQERLKRMQWLYERRPGGFMTPSELGWINTRVGELHGRQL